ncbi:hypothetical protein [Legionella sp.]|uniref:hypothetical protein n=1 Tax=Legionella sp. TaxID=459 RepID=UPI003D1215C0
MLEIKTCNASSFPKNAVDNLITAINASIKHYNGAPTLEKKLDHLQNIKTKLQEFNYKYPMTMFEKATDFRLVQENLFKEIKYQYASLGQTSLLNTTTEQPLLNEVIANMSPEKANKLLSILNKGRNSKLGSELKTLYDATDNSKEAQDFMVFLNTHQLSFLGGGNSQNFKVTRLADGYEAVLKVDNRLNMPREVEAQLRHSIPEVFAPIHTERMVFYADSNSKAIIGRTLQVTEFYSDGNLIDQRPITLHQIEQNTAKIFTQMSSTFLKIEQAGCAFPDAKMTNWLIDDNGNVRLADTKSFLFTNAGQITRTDRREPYKYYGLTSTQGFIPPEFSSATFDASKTHSYLLGKNLYLYTTGEEYVDEDNGADFEFDYEFFQKSRFGTDYRQLIEGLAQPDPKSRMPVNEALTRLTIIDQLTTLNTLQTGSREHQKSIKHYIQEEQKLLRNADPKKLDELAQNVKQRLDYETVIATLHSLKSNGQKTNKIIDEFIQNSAQEFKTANSDEREQIIQILRNESPSIERRKRYNVAIDELDKLKFGNNDRQMTEYIEKQEQKFIRALSPAAQEKIITEIQEMTENLQKNAAVAKIRSIVNNFREEANLFTIGMNAKADRIEGEMAKVPLEARCHFVSNKQTPEVDNVLKQLASRRSLLHDGKIHLTDKGDIDEKKAAQSFKDFKNKFKEQCEQPEENISEEIQTNEFKR